MRFDRFENVCFFGERSNLAPELPTAAGKAGSEANLALTSWSAVRIAGMTTVKPTVLWRREVSDVPRTCKASHELYNAWLAGVPFIGGMDSAYTADGMPGAISCRPRHRELLRISGSFASDPPCDNNWLPRAEFLRGTFPSRPLANAGNTC
jgi:hypothetical protein